MGDGLRREISEDSVGLREFGIRLVSLNVRGFEVGKQRKFGWVKGICSKEKPNFLAIQESKTHTRGKILLWDLSVFDATNEISCDFFNGVQGIWKPTGIEVTIINVYGPHDDQSKGRMWDSLDKLLNDGEDAWILCGDFNEVRDVSERLNYEFIASRARRFNEYIANNKLIEIPLGGRKFTRISDYGIKMSKLDRFLVSKKFHNLWGNLSAIALDRDRSDHCPIILRDTVVDFEPKPFKIFDEWLVTEGVEKIIGDAWSKKVSGNRKDCNFRNKLKKVKLVLKSWSQSVFHSLDDEIELFKTKAIEFELKAENGVFSDIERLEWLNARKMWFEKERIKTNMYKQKARVGGL
ncbi:uncharacterized protein [Rutidosis leptorrhynchoides]|uniref:uncharacterized protein n=1 Tax=Rutidosis leptorrhynchoides TaxID=125765 RepID=UPI003A99B7AF